MRIRGATTLLIACSLWALGCQKTRKSTATTTSAPLEALLDGAGVKPPWVLVGHSIGGLTMQFFAKDRLDDVVGVVLVEAAGDPMALWSLMPKEAIDKRRAELASSPEGLDLDTFVDDAKAAAASPPSLGSRPLVVVTRGKPDAPPTASAAVSGAWLARWNEQQAQLVKLSMNSTQVIAPASGHMVPAEAPEIVVTAVRDVLRAARDHTQVGAPR